MNQIKFCSRCGNSNDTVTDLCETCLDEIENEKIKMQRE